MPGDSAEKRDHMRDWRGLIAAAGQSRRMGAFKPLLTLNGFPMIQMTVQSLKNGGIQDITVVIGREADRMREILAPMGVRLTENRDFASTDMLASVKKGLSGMRDAEGVFFLPGDLPLVSPKTMAYLKKEAEGLEKGMQGMIPLLNGKHAHPLFLSPEGYDAVLSYGGEGGLGAVSSKMRMKKAESRDPGTLKDADYPSDLEEMRAYARKFRGISADCCAQLYEEVRLPAHIRAHCRAVGDLAARMAETLISRGACLDVELCRSGGYLHDLCRLQPHHEQAAAIFLEEKGYGALAEIAGAHGGFAKEPESICRESAIVFLADKLVQEDRRVTVAERYQKALGKNPVKERVRKNIALCRRLIAEFEERTGERLEETCIHE